MSFCRQKPQQELGCGGQIFQSLIDETKQFSSTNDIFRSLITQLSGNSTMKLS